MNAAAVIPFRRTRAAAGSPSRVVLRVEFAAPDGGRWAAIGGGASVPEAIAEARAATPLGPAWRTVRWNDLYGD